MALDLQQLILDLLDSSNEIKDTRALTLPGDSKPATSQEAQLQIQGALNSLLSREVCGGNLDLSRYLPNHLLEDDCVLDAGSLCARSLS